MWPFRSRPRSHHPEHCACGAHGDDRDMHVRFGVPDRVLELPEAEQTPGVGMNHEDAMRAVFLEEPALGCFVRSLLRLPLTESSSLTYGLWVRVRPEDARRIGRMWNDPEYAGLQFDGWLANELVPFGHLDAPVHLEVDDPNETPYVARSESPELHALLTTTSDRRMVLEAVGLFETAATPDLTRGSS